MTDHSSKGSQDSYKEKKAGLPVIGWREKVSLPAWNIKGIRAKIDTGARTSAIHVANLQTLDNGNVRFEVVISERPKHKTVWVEATPVREGIVKPSSGIRQRRIVCRTVVRLGKKSIDTEISLVCRKGMLCRMLIGRRTIARKFMVDPSNKYLLPNRKPLASQKENRA